MTKRTGTETLRTTTITTCTGTDGTQSTVTIHRITVRSARVGYGVDMKTEDAS